MELSLIFPCYLEEPHLERNIDKVIRLLSLSNIDYEIVLVEDCSPDGTKEVVNKLARKYPDKVRAAFHAKNQGRGQAFMTGFSLSKGEIVGFFDVDLEVSAVYVFECIDTLRTSGCDLVVGGRIYKTHLGLIYRHILSSGYSSLVRGILKIPALDTESGYKFFKRSALTPYVNKFIHKGWFWDTEVVSRFVWENKKVESVPCLFLRNEEKRSTVKPLRDAVEYLFHLLKFRKEYSKRMALGDIKPETQYAISNKAA